MARIKKLKENGKTIYPVTILDAVVDPSTNRKLSNTAIRYFTGGVSLYYKFMSFDIGGDKGMIRFGIFSPLLGYGEFLIDWGWQGSTEKHCYPYCLFSTNAQMYNRVKLVRTGDSTFDAYFESNPGNDYATFVFMGQSGTSVKSFSASGISSIPTAYKESAHAGNIFFGSIDVANLLRGNSITSNGFVRIAGSVDNNRSIFYDDNGGKKIGLRWHNPTTNKDFEIFIHSDGKIKIVQSDGVYRDVYHSGNLGIATSSKAGLVKGGGDITVDSSGNVTVNQSKALVSRTETDINAEVFKSPGVYVAPISMIDVSGSEIGLYGKSTIITIGNNDNSGYIEQVIITTIDDETKMFFRGWDLTTEAYEFSPLLPDIATSSKAGTVKSGGDISVDSLGNTSVKRNSFNNAGDDAINIDNYPQADYGVIPIWLNTAEADGNPPGREGLVFQAKYRSEQGSSGTEYVDCLSQFYVGNEGVRHRTIVDYDEATKFENTPWSKINDDWYFDLGTATVASSTSSSANVTFTGSSAFSSIRTLLDGLSLATMSNAMPNISLGFSLATGNGITHYIRTKVSSISRMSNGNYALFAMYQNPLFGDENYVNVLRISITPSSYSCQTLKSL